MHFLIDLLYWFKASPISFGSTECIVWSLTFSHFIWLIGFNNPFGLSNALSVYLHKFMFKRLLSGWGFVWIWVWICMISSQQACSIRTCPILTLFWFMAHYYELWLQSLISLSVLCVSNSSRHECIQWIF